MRITELYKGHNSIPLRRAVRGKTLPCWIIYGLDEDEDRFLIGDAADKLSTYETAEEEGLLLTLPARLGQEVFVIDKPNSLLEESVFKGKILDIRLTEDGLLFMVIMEVIEDQKHPELMYYRGAIKEFGKNMFLTESTAKSALERKKNA